MLDTKQLCDRLAITSRELSAWLREGLPSEGRGKKRQFDPAAVAAWLRQTGRAQVEAQPSAMPAVVVTTRDEAARLLGVNLRTLATWLTEPSFPGKAGSPGRQDGYFPIDQIQLWWQARCGADHRTKAGSSEEVAKAKLRRLLIEADLQQIELERATRSLLDADDVARLAERMIATAKTRLDQVADQVNARLPAKFPRQLRRMVRRTLLKAIAEACDDVAELVAGDSDDLTDDPDVSPDAAAPAS